MKTIKINELKVKVFTKEDLKEKIKFTDDEVKLIMKYQKTFPELLQDDDIEGFVINARILWEQLDKPHTQFNKWVDRKVLKYYEENIDFRRMDKFVQGDKHGYGNAKLKEYYLTLECAKNVAMSEHTPKGRLTRTYFILMEKALRKMDKWIVVREPEKEGYKELCRCLQLMYMKNNNYKKPNSSLFYTEADMINEALLGKKAKEIRKILGAKDNQTREHLDCEVNQALYELQILDSNLVTGGAEFSLRQKLITNACETRYKNLCLAINKELHIAC